MESVRRWTIVQSNTHALNWNGMEWDHGDDATSKAIDRLEYFFTGEGRPSV